MTQQKGFVKFPNQIIRTNTISMVQKMVLLALCSFADRQHTAFPSYKTLAEVCGISRRRVISAVKELELLGFIRKMHAKSSHGDYTSNRYKLLVWGNDNIAPPDENSSPQGSAENAPRSEQAAPNQYSLKKRYINKLNNIHPPSASDVTRMEKRIKENIEYDLLKVDYPSEVLDEMTALITEAAVSCAPTIRIAGSDVPTETVRDTFLSLNSEHIKYAIEGFSRAGNIKNIKAYMLTVAYNAPKTMNTYYNTLAERDIKSGFSVPKRTGQTPAPVSGDDTLKYCFD